MKQDCHGEHGEITEDTEGCAGIGNESEFRLGDFIQALCELTDPKRERLEKNGGWIVGQERE